MNDTAGEDWSFWSLPLGAMLDAILGDPRAWPHPVRAIGQLIATTERALRRGWPGPGVGPRAERAGRGWCSPGCSRADGPGRLGRLVTGGDRLGGLGSLLGRGLLSTGDWPSEPRRRGPEGLGGGRPRDGPTRAVDDRRARHRDARPTRDLPGVRRDGRRELQRRGGRAAVLVRRGRRPGALGLQGGQHPRQHGGIPR